MAGGRLIRCYGRLPRLAASPNNRRDDERRGCCHCGPIAGQVGGGRRVIGVPRCTARRSPRVWMSMLKGWLGRGRRAELTPPSRLDEVVLTAELPLPVQAVT